MLLDYSFWIYDFTLFLYSHGKSLFCPGSLYILNNKSINYISYQTVFYEFGLFDGVINNMRNLINRNKRIGVSSCCKFVHLWPRPLNIVNRKYIGWSVNVSRDKYFGVRFLYVVVSIIICLSGLDWLFYKFGSRSSNIINFHDIPTIIIGESFAFSIRYSREVHGLYRLIICEICVFHND